MNARNWRILALLLAVLLLTGLLAVGCTPAQEEETPGEEEQQQEQAGEEVSEPELETLRFVLDTESFRELEAQAIAQQLRDLGIDVQVKVWEWSALKAKIKEGERLAYLTDWGSAFFDPFDLGVPKLRTGDRGNYSFYSNPEFDELMVTAITTADEDVRRDAYFRAQEILKEDAPWVFGYYMKAVEASSVDVQNWEPSMDSRINLHDVSLASGDTIVVGMATDSILSLDPASSYRDRETETVIRNMFDGLVTRTHDGKVVPELAESWDISEDGLTYTFKLRDGVYFHNGDQLDADDVVFTFEKILGLGAFADTEGTSRAGLIRPSGVELTVEKVDEMTVRFTFSKPFPVFLQGLVHQQIVPRDYYLEVGEEGFGKAPVGTGPFKFVSGKLDDQIVLERFDDYYGGSPDLPPVGPAPIKRAIFKMVPEPATRIAGLKAGELGIVQAIPPDLIASLEADENIVVKYVEGTRNYALELNNAKPPFDDIRVRKALNYAINWELILDEIYGGLATRLATAFLPSGFGYNPDVEPYPYDPERAKELLKEAGYATK